MKIIFNLMNVGLGANGGSLTIIECANTLQDLGHEVTIIDTGKNLNFWIPLRAKHMIIRNNNDIPNADVIIATGFKSWQPTIDLPSRHGKKFVYVRGWETWNAPEKTIFRILSNPKLKVIVNSACLVNKLAEEGIIPWIVRPGNDFKKFKYLNIRNPNTIILGGLFNSGSKRSPKRTEWVFDTYREVKKQFSGETSLYMFGCEGSPSKKIDLYIKNPSNDEKNDLYNMVDIWLSPSELEGLHIPPQEAMLTECCVVGTNAPMSGTQDYLINMKTGIVADNNLDDFIRKTMLVVNDTRLRTGCGHEGRLKIRTLGDRIDNMKKMEVILGDYV